MGFQARRNSSRRGVTIVLSEAAVKEAEDAIWRWFEPNIFSAYFSYRNEYNRELGSSAMFRCSPGEELSVEIPAISTTREPVDSVYVVYCDDKEDMLLSICLGQGRLNEWIATAKSPTRNDIRLSDSVLGGEQGAPADESIF